MKQQVARYTTAPEMSEGIDIPYVSSISHYSFSALRLFVYLFV